MVKYDEDREAITGHSHEGVDNLHKNSFNRVEDMKPHRHRGLETSLERTEKRMGDEEVKSEYR